MREYRVYDTEQKRYVTYERIWALTQDGTLYYINNDNGHFVKAHNCTVEWETGLTDKHGNKIFEGHIVKVVTPNGISGRVKIGIGEDSTTGEKAISVYGEYINGERGYMVVGKSECYEILGNIHENAELLEVEQ